MRVGARLKVGTASGAATRAGTATTSSGMGTPAAKAKRPANTTNV